MCRIVDNMIVTFEEKYLQELYETGKTADKRHRFQPEIVRKYQYCIRYLLGASCIEALYPVSRLNYEELKGDKSGISSIRVNKKYRIEFTPTLVIWFQWQYHIIATITVFL